MKPTLIVSLDFELFWGMLDVCPLCKYEQNVLGGRAAIPKLLNLFEKYGIHATWATVGFQFGEDKSQAEGFFPPEILRPSYANPKLNPYKVFDTLGEREEEAPCFFAPGLIEQIGKTSGQEIASHTFCHFYCREPGQTLEQYTADLTAASAIAESRGIRLTSLVLPRNQSEPEYTAAAGALGFTACRDEENDWIHRKIRWTPLKRILRLMDVYLPLSGQGGFVPEKRSGVWMLTGSRMYKPIFEPLSCLEGFKLRRIKKQMLHAAKNGLCFHLWWHPHNIGVRTQEHLAQLEDIFQYFSLLRDQYGMESRNMGELARELEG